MARLINQTPTPEQKSPNGTTPLLYAALRGDAKSVDLLLDFGADPNASNVQGVTPLIWGAYDAEKTRLLLDAGANPNARSKRGNTPLAVAAAHPNGFPSAALLIQSGAKVDTRNRRRHTPLGAAVFSGSHETVELLLEQGANAADHHGNSNVPTILSMASERRDPKIVAWLLEHGANPNSADQFTGHALNRALLSNKPDIAHLLLNHRANPTLLTPLHGDTPLQLATYTESDDPSLLALLIQKGAPNEHLYQQNQLGEGPLNWATRRGHPQVIEFLTHTEAPEERSADKRKTIPNRPLTIEQATSTRLLSDSVQRSLSLQQKSSDVFLQNRENCVSCHHQYIVGPEKSI